MERREGEARSWPSLAMRFANASEDTLTGLQMAARSARSFTPAFQHCMQRRRWGRRWGSANHVFTKGCNRFQQQVDWPLAIVYTQLFARNMSGLSSPPRLASLRFPPPTSSHHGAAFNNAHCKAGLREQPGRSCCCATLINIVGATQWHASTVGAAHFSFGFDSSFDCWLAGWLVLSLVACLVTWGFVLRC